MKTCEWCYKEFEEADLKVCNGLLLCSDCQEIVLSGPEGEDEDAED